MEQSDDNTIKWEAQKHNITHLVWISIEFESYFPFLTAISDDTTDQICSPITMMQSPRQIYLETIRIISSK
jgi:hypothetical protein